MSWREDTRTGVIQVVGSRSRGPDLSVTLASVNWPLTRRRTVDLCRVAGCLCRSS
ncbi:putative leader peptide [Pseudonocardia sp.]|uniref:putative leader peptide n=1 Tax=Pseudonocardia sp. TaxID=60912 RepID=UPI003456F68A